MVDEVVSELADKIDVLGQNSFFTNLPLNFINLHFDSHFHKTLQRHPYYYHYLELKLNIRFL